RRAPPVSRHPRGRRAHAQFDRHRGRPGSRGTARDRRGGPPGRLSTHEGARPLNVAVAIGGLAFLILIHEAGHFFVALAVRMRPRRFYIFFPPPLVKWKRKGIEYGI